MAAVGDRVQVPSKRVGQAPREGVVTGVSGALLRVTWSGGEESTIFPAMGSLVVVGKVGTGARKAVSKKAPPRKAVKKAAGPAPKSAKSPAKPSAKRAKSTPKPAKSSPKPAKSSPKQAKSSTKKVAKKSGKPHPRASKASSKRSPKRRK